METVVIPFPRHRVRAKQRANADWTPILIEHAGLRFPLADLLDQIPPHITRELAEDLPLHGQALWEEIVRRWPVFAQRIVASRRRFERGGT